MWNALERFCFFSMIQRFMLLCCVCAPVSLIEPVFAGDWLLFEPSTDTPTDAPGRGKHIVLISGDEEYRSEEALPQIAAILSQRHGFRCTVLFAIAPETGLVSPDERTNIPGLEILEDADCLVLFTRFRNLPDDQMSHIDRYVRSGRPVLGIRTATHAFNIEQGRAFSHYSWNHTPGGDAAESQRDWEGGFGRLVLGETWIAHHGRHGSQATQGIVSQSAQSHPIVRGLGFHNAPSEGLAGVWGPSDVYRVRLPMADDVTPLVMGRVLEGMTPQSPVADGDQNHPEMPIAWVKPYQVPGGAPGVSMTSTLGAATDLIAEGSRRLLVNGVYWLCGLGDSIPVAGTDVTLVGRFEPSAYGFGGFRQGLVPSAFSPLDQDEPTPDVPEALQLRDGDRVVLIGNTFAERLAASGYFAAMVHAAHPDLELSVRHLPWSADEVAFQPREMGVPTTMDRLSELDATVIIACYGMSESFGGSQASERFARDLDDFLDSLKNARLASDREVRVGLVSPIRHEDLGGSWVSGAQLDERNRQLEKYTEVMRQSARKAGVLFCDLYDFQSSQTQLTTNGIHPSEEGCRQYARRIGESFGWLADMESRITSEDLIAADRARRVAADLYYHERLWYRPTNTEYVYGRRHEPFGVVNFPPEIEQLKRMINARDRAIQKIETSPAAVFAAPLSDKPVWENVPSSQDFPEDQWSPEPVEAEGTETSLGSLEIADPDAFMESFTLAGGYAVNVFASEEMFPQLANPLAMTFDEQHRLWVICAHTYPHLLPGESPRCQILVVEDSDLDGVADSCSVFADQLYIPTGFVVDVDAVYLGQAPDLLRLSDIDGDGVADRREVIYTGFSMPDSHHTISSFEWDPHGGFLMHEGVFGISGVETPWGTQRSRDAVVWRFDTRTSRLTRLSHSGFANPWGHAFDNYGQSVLADASGGANFSFSQVINASEGIRKPVRGDPILNRGRPTAGCEILTSRHFPDDLQGTFLVNQCIGFHGTRWNRLQEPDGDSSAWTAQALGQDLIESSDVNFRPVAMETGPDGTLFIADWCNPIIGHMQYSVRDPRRDATHGRVWRVRHASRNTLVPPVIPSELTEESLSDLLELLRLPEANTRRHARRRLHLIEDEGVLSLALQWFNQISPQDPLYERLHLEMLWLIRACGRTDMELLARVASMEDPRVRAGAVRVLRHWLDEDAVAPGPALRVLARAANDSDMRVRLEAVVACGFADTPDTLSVLESASSLPMDTALQRAMEESVRMLSRYERVVSDFARQMQLEQMSAEQLLQQPVDSMFDRVVLVRQDLPVDLRRQAASRIALAEKSMSLAEIITEASNPLNAAAAIAPVLLAQDADRLRSERDAYEKLSRMEGRVGALGMGVLERLGELDLSMFRKGDPRLLLLVEMFPQAEISNSLILRLLQETQSGLHPASQVADAVSLHAQNVEVGRTISEFFDRWIEEVQGFTLADWDNRAMLANAGLRGYALVGGDAYAPLASEGQMDLGKAVYESETNGCVRCHASDGAGLEGFPPLKSSAWVHGNPNRIISVVLHGLFGELAISEGQVFNSAMAPMGQLLNDEEAAAVVTYVRQSFGNFAPPVSPAEVGFVRGRSVSSRGLWGVEELLQRYPLSADLIVDHSYYRQSQAGMSSNENPVGIFASRTAALILGFFICSGGLLILVTRSSAGASS